MGRWPAGQPITWALFADNLTAQEAAMLTGPIARGIESWAAVCGVTIKRYDGTTPEPNVQVVFVADLVSDPTVPFDESQAWAWQDGTELGLTDEPVNAGPATELRMRLNPNPAALGNGANTWTAQALEEVARHEFGHALGFDHPDPSIESCMSAYLDQRVSTQTRYDIAVAQSVYGPPLGASNAVSPSGRVDSGNAAERPAPTDRQLAGVPAVPATGAGPDGGHVSRPGTGSVRDPVHRDEAPRPAESAGGGQSPSARKASMNPAAIFALLTSAIPADVANLIIAQLRAGTPLDTAVRSVLAQLEQLIPNPLIRVFVSEALGGLLTVAEEIAAAAAGKALPQATAPTS